MLCFLVCLSLSSSYPSRAPEFTPVFCWVPCCISFLCCSIMHLSVLSSVLWCPLRFRIKRCSVRPYLLLFVGGLMSHLRYLCLCLCILMSKAYCVVFVFFVLCLAYPILPVSLNCSFLITPSVFSNVYLSCVLCTQCCQFLWNVHSWLPLLYSLAFICSVSYVPNVASFSGMFILDYPFGIL